MNCVLYELYVFHFQGGILKLNFLKIMFAFLECFLECFAIIRVSFGEDYSRIVTKTLYDEIDYG